MKAEQIKSKLKRLGAWEQFDANYMAREDKDPGKESTIKFLETHPNFKDAIECACVWDKTIEGHKYWSNIANGK